MARRRISANVELELNRSGVRELLRSPEVLADLRARAERVAAAAGAGMEVEATIGPNRARAEVATGTTEARLAEARHRRLSRSIDAAR